MNKQILVAASALLAASAIAVGPAAAQPMSQMPTAASTPTAAPMAAPESSDYVMMAGQSDAFETQSSQLALNQAKSGRVKGFAKMMVDDHAKTTATLMKAAAKSGMAPPPAPPPLTDEQQTMITQLQNATGADFDRTYMSQQVAAHQKALDLHSSYAKGGSDPNLMKAAKATVPIVSKHLQMARGIATGLGTM